MTILEFVVTHLSEALTVPVRIQKPNDDDGIPEEYVLVEKTGFSIENYINTATVAVQTHAKQLYAAEDLIIDVRNAMLSLAENDQISAVRLETDYPWPDASRKEDRYQAVFTITHYLED